MMRLPCTTRRRGSLSAALLCSMVATRGPADSQALTEDNNRSTRNSLRDRGPGVSTKGLPGCLSDSSLTLKQGVREGKGEA